MTTYIGHEDALLRRKEDELMSPENHEKRISLLEVLAENGEKQRLADQKRVDYIETKMDAHLVQTSKNQEATAREVGRLASAVENIGADVKDALVASSDAKANMLTAKAVWSAVLAMAAAGTVASTAVWAIFTYFIAK